MSRAFTKESDGALDPLPDLPVSPHPNHVTPRGLADLRARLLARQADLTLLRARADRLDKLPEAAAERDIRYLESRLRSAILIDPAQLPLTEVAFGLIITVAQPDGNQTRLQIVGEDEADPAQGRITAQSPLARALMGAMPGDSVDWKKPGGTVSLEILSLSHPDSSPMPDIRALHPLTDRAIVAALLEECADYIRLERDGDPDDTVVTEFFTDAPPGCDPAASHRLGLFDGTGRLTAIAEMAIGYPDPDAAYLGFMAVAARARGTGMGQQFLSHLEKLARADGCRRLYLAVLDANPRGRAFWEREGFTLAAANRPVTLGQKTQIAHRLTKLL